MAPVKLKLKKKPKLDPKEAERQKLKAEYARKFADEIFAKKKDDDAEQTDVLQPPLVAAGKYGGPTMHYQRKEKPKMTLQEKQEYQAKKLRKMRAAGLIADVKSTRIYSLPIERGLSTQTYLQDSLERLGAQLAAWPYSKERLLGMAVRFCGAALRGCDVYVGLLAPRGDELRFVAATDRSGMAGRALARGRGHSWAVLAPGGPPAVVATPEEPGAVRLLGGAVLPVAAATATEGGGGGSGARRGLPSLPAVAAALVPGGGGAPIGVIGADRFCTDIDADPLAARKLAEAEEARLKEQNLPHRRAAAAAGGDEDPLRAGEDQAHLQRLLPFLNDDEAGIRAARLLRDPTQPLTGKEEVDFEVPPARLVAGRVTEVHRFLGGRPRPGGPAYTVRWDDGLEEKQLPFRFIEKILRNTAHSLGEGTVFGPPITDYLVQVGKMVGEKYNQMRMDESLEIIQSVTKDEACSVETVYKVLLEAVVQNILSNRIAEIWHIDRSEGTIECVARMDHRNQFSQSQQARSLPRQFTEEETYAFHKKVARFETFELQYASEIIIASFEDFAFKVGKVAVGRRATAKCALVVTRAPGRSSAADLAFAGRLARAAGGCLGAVRGRQHRAEIRRQSLRRVKKMCADWTATQTPDLCSKALAEVAACLPGVSAYVALARPGVWELAYLRATPGSRAPGAVLARATPERVSFEALDRLRAMVVRGDEAAEARAAARTHREGDRVLVSYGKLQFPGTVTKCWGHDSFDVAYETGEKEAGVPGARLVQPPKWVPTVHPLTDQQPNGWPFVCVPVADAGARVGVLGVDGFEGVGKGRPDGRHPERGVADYLYSVGAFLGPPIARHREAAAIAALRSAVADFHQNEDALMIRALDVLTETLVSRTSLRVFFTAARADAATGAVPIHKQLAWFERPTGAGGAPEATLDAFPAPGQPVLPGGVEEPLYKTLIHASQKVRCRILDKQEDTLVGKFPVYDYSWSDKLVGKNLLTPAFSGSQALVVRRRYAGQETEAAFLETVCQVMDVSLRCIRGRRWRAKLRRAGLKRVLELCEGWGEWRTVGELAEKVVATMELMFPLCDVYCAELAPFGAALEFGAASSASGAAGKRLRPGRGASWAVVEGTGRPPLVLLGDDRGAGGGGAGHPRPVHFGDPARMAWPLVVAALTAAADPPAAAAAKEGGGGGGAAVVGTGLPQGVLAVDGFSRAVPDDQGALPEPGTVGMVAAAAAALGAAGAHLRRRRALADLAAMVHCKEGFDVDVAYATALEVLSRAIAQATRLEIWELRVLHTAPSPGAAGGGGDGGGGGGEGGGGGGGGRSSPANPPRPAAPPKQSLDLVLRVCGLEGLYPEAKCGRVKTYCKVYWNGTLLGRTPASGDCHDMTYPPEESTFRHPIPEDRSGLSLEIEVLEARRLGRDRLVGLFLLEGDIVPHLSPFPRAYRLLPAFAEDGSIIDPGESAMLVLDFGMRKRGFEAPLLDSNDDEIQVCLQVHEAKNLRKADTFGKSDPFCIIKVNGQKLGKTSTIYNTLNPKWEDEQIFTFKVPRSDPYFGVEIELWDEDLKMKGDFLGKARLRPEDLLRPVLGHAEFPLSIERTPTRELRSPFGFGSRPGSRPASRSGSPLPTSAEGFLATGRAEDLPVTPPPRGPGGAAAAGGGPAGGGGGGNPQAAGGGGAVLRDDGRRRSRSASSSSRGRRLAAALARPFSRSSNRSGSPAADKLPRAGGRPGTRGPPTPSGGGGGRRGRSGGRGRSAAAVAAAGEGGGKGQWRRRGGGGVGAADEETALDRRGRPKSRARARRASAASSSSRGRGGGGGPPSTSAGPSTEGDAEEHGTAGRAAATTALAHRAPSLLRSERRRRAGANSARHYLRTAGAVETAGAGARRRSLLAATGGRRAPRTGAAALFSSAAKTKTADSQASGSVVIQIKHIAQGPEEAASSPASAHDDGRVRLEAAVVRALTAAGANLHRLPVDEETLAQFKEHLLSHADWDAPFALPLGAAAAAAERERVVAAWGAEGDEDSSTAAAITESLSDGDGTQGDGGGDGGASSGGGGGEGEEKGAGGGGGAAEWQAAGRAPAVKVLVPFADMGVIIGDGIVGPALDRVFAVGLGGLTTETFPPAAPFLAEAGAELGKAVRSLRASAQRAALFDRCLRRLRALCLLGADPAGGLGADALVEGVLGELLYALPGARAYVALLRPGGKGIKFVGCSENAVALKEWEVEHDPNEQDFFEVTKKGASVKVLRPVPKFLARQLKIELRQVEQAETNLKGRARSAIKDGGSKIRNLFSRKNKKNKKQGSTPNAMEKQRRRRNKNAPPAESSDTEISDLEAPAAGEAYDDEFSVVTEGDEEAAAAAARGEGEEEEEEARAAAVALQAQVRGRLARKKLHIKVDSMGASRTREERGPAAAAADKTEEDEEAEEERRRRLAEFKRTPWGPRHHGAATALQRMQRGRAVRLRAARGRAAAAAEARRLLREASAVRIQAAARGWLVRLRGLLAARAAKGERLAAYALAAPLVSGAGRGDGGGCVGALALADLDALGLATAATAPPEPGVLALAAAAGAALGEALDRRRKALAAAQLLAPLQDGRVEPAFLLAHLARSANRLIVGASSVQVWRVDPEAGSIAVEARSEGADVDVDLNFLGHPEPLQSAAPFVVADHRQHGGPSHYYMDLALTLLRADRVPVPRGKGGGEGVVLYAVVTCAGEELGRTEEVPADTPEWGPALGGRVLLPFDGEEDLRPARVEVYRRAGSRAFSREELVGTHELAAAELLRLPPVPREVVLKAPDSSKKKGGRSTSSFFDVSEPALWLRVDTAREVLREDPPRRRGTVVLHVKHARRLARADTFGQSDPYVVVRDGDQIIGKTKVKKKTLNPVWRNEKFTLQVPEDKAGWQVTLTVYDHDIVGSDDFLGQVVLDTPTLLHPPAGEVGMPLEKDLAATLKENKLVQGELIFKLKYKPPKLWAGEALPRPPARDTEYRADYEEAPAVIVADVQAERQHRIREKLHLPLTDAAVADMNRLLAAGGGAGGDLARITTSLGHYDGLSTSGGPGGGPGGGGTLTTPGGLRSPGPPASLSRAPTRGPAAGEAGPLLSVRSSNTLMGSVAEESSSAAAAGGASVGGGDLLVGSGRTGGGSGGGGGPLASPAGPRGGGLASSRAPTARTARGGGGGAAAAFAALARELAGTTLISEVHAGQVFKGLRNGLSSILLTGSGRDRIVVPFLPKALEDNDDGDGAAKPTTTDGRPMATHAIAVEGPPGFLSREDAAYARSLRGQVDAVRAAFRARYSLQDECSRSQQRLAEICGVQDSVLETEGEQGDASQEDNQSKGTVGSKGAGVSGESIQDQKSKKEKLFQGPQRVQYRRGSLAHGLSVAPRRSLAEEKEVETKGDEETRPEGPPRANDLLWRLQLAVAEASQALRGCTVLIALLEPGTTNLPVACATDGDLLRYSLVLPAAMRRGIVHGGQFYLKVGQGCRRGHAGWGPGGGGGGGGGVDQALLYAAAAGAEGEAATLRARDSERVCEEFVAVPLLAPVEGGGGAYGVALVLGLGALKPAWAKPLGADSLLEEGVLGYATALGRLTGRAVGVARRALVSEIVEGGKADLFTAPGFHEALLGAARGCFPWTRIDLWKIRKEEVLLTETAVPPGTAVDEENPEKRPTSSQLKFPFFTNSRPGTRAGGGRSGTSSVVTSRPGTSSVAADDALRRRWELAPPKGNRRAVLRARVHGQPEGGTRPPTAAAEGKEEESGKKEGSPERKLPSMLRNSRSHDGSPAVKEKGVGEWLGVDEEQEHMLVEEWKYCELREDILSFTLYTGHLALPLKPARIKPPETIHQKGKGAAAAAARALPSAVAGRRPADPLLAGAGLVAHPRLPPPAADAADADNDNQIAILLGDEDDPKAEDEDATLACGTFLAELAAEMEEYRLAMEEEEASALAGEGTVDKKMNI